MISFIKLNKEIFEYDSIICAINSYAEIADIKITEDDQYWLLDIMDATYGIDITKKEMVNYIISLLGSRA